MTSTITSQQKRLGSQKFPKYAVPEEVLAEEDGGRKTERGGGRTT
jgi:hypothetical protein